MDVAPIQRHLAAADIAPERLAGNSQLSEREKIAEASRQFEAVLLRQILESTQKTVIPSKFADNSTAASIYRDMITSQLADSISESGTFGLAKTFEQQLNRPSTPVPKAGHGTIPHASSPTSHEGVASARPHSRPEPGIPDRTVPPHTHFSPSHETSVVQPD
jgi:peptidoglycan hydrolase FlgJ